MSVQKVLKMGEPSLLLPSAEVVDFDTPQLRALVSDLYETMEAYHGVGIAAPQIGVNQQVVIFGFESNPRYPDVEPISSTVLINPTITALTDKEDLYWEACLSVPGLRGEVPRWTKIRYQGFDINGEIIDRVVEGFHARVVQHEYDHLLGILYPQRIRDMKKFRFEETQAK